MNFVQNIPLRIGVRLEEFDVNEETKSWPSRKVAGGLIWLAISIRPDTANAVRSVVRYYSAPKAIQWKSTLCVLAYTNGASTFCSTY